MIDGVLNNTWVSAKYCTDLISNSSFDYDVILEQINSELNNKTSGWICPDVENITVTNNPSVFAAGNGTEFVMVVNSCKQAMEIDGNFTLSSYTNETCADHNESFKIAP